MESSLCFNTKNLGVVHCIYGGVTGYNFTKNCVFISLKMDFVFANNVDPALCSISFGSSLFAKDHIRSQLCTKDQKVQAEYHLQYFSTYSLHTDFSPHFGNMT